MVTLSRHRAKFGQLSHKAADITVQANLLELTPWRFPNNITIPSPYRARLPFACAGPQSQDNDAGMPNAASRKEDVN